MRLILGEHDITMGAGEVAEFDTKLPHWFGPADDQPVEVLSLHNRAGHHPARARPTAKGWAHARGMTLFSGAGDQAPAEPV